MKRENQAEARGRKQIAILGAGPVGLELALAAAQSGLAFTVYEAASSPAAHVRSWGHVRLFTPWSMDVSPRVRERLARAAVEPPSSSADCPTGNELVARVFEPLAKLPEIAPHIRYGTRVLEVGREGLTKDQEIANATRAARGFRLLVEDVATGVERIERATTVLDATGTYGNPNALGDGGIPAPGERAAGSAIERRIPEPQADPEAWRGRRVLLVGGGHSAQTAARDFSDLAAQGLPFEITWAVRGERPRPGVADDALPERARLAARTQQLWDEPRGGFQAMPNAGVDSVEPADGGAMRVNLRTPGGHRIVVADHVVSLTGSVGDHRLYRQLQVHECYATAGPMKLSAKLLGEAAGGDCLQTTAAGIEVLANPEPGFFFLGSKSYGRNAVFLLRSGWEQATEVVASLEA